MTFVFVHINLSLPCRKLSPDFVGPFTIRALCGTNAVTLDYLERFQLLNPKVNIEYLRPYRLRTPDIGPPPKLLTVGKILMPVMTLGLGVKAFLLRFKLMSSF